MLTYLTVWIRSLLRDEEGATAIEYAQIAAVVAVVIVAAFAIQGSEFDGFFTGILDPASHESTGT